MKPYSFRYAINIFATELEVYVSVIESGRVTNQFLHLNFSPPKTSFIGSNKMQSQDDRSEL